MHRVSWSRCAYNVLTVQLHVCADCIALLLKNGADARCPQHDGNTPMDVAKNDAVKQLLQKSLRHLDLSAEKRGTYKWLKRSWVQWPSLVLIWRRYFFLMAVYVRHLSWGQDRSENIHFSFDWCQRRTEELKKWGNFGERDLSKHVSLTCVLNSFYFILIKRWLWRRVSLRPLELELSIRKYTFIAH